MSNRFINKVLVIESFPGFIEGDVLGLNTENGLFEYLYNDKAEASGSDNALNNIYKELAEYKPSLSKEHILDDMSYFQDISEYETKSKDWMEERMLELKKFITNIDADSKEGLLPESVDVKEAKTVWQNLIWEYETILGMRRQYRSDL